MQQIYMYHINIILSRIVKENIYELFAGKRKPKMPVEISIIQLNHIQRAFRCVVHTSECYGR